MAAICSGFNRRSLTKVPDPGSGSQGGIVRFAVTVAIRRARLMTSLYSMRLKGAISPGRWQEAQCAQRIGAMSLLKVIGAAETTPEPTLTAKDTKDTKGTIDRIDR